KIPASHASLRGLLARWGLTNPVTCGNIWTVEARPAQGRQTRRGRDGPDGDDDRGTEGSGGGGGGGAPGPRDADRARARDDLDERLQRPALRQAVDRPHHDVGGRRPAGDR